MNNAISLLLLLAILAGSHAWAREVSRTTGLSQKRYEEMQEVQAMIENGDVRQAKSRLDAMLAKRLTDYERAQTWFLMGYVHYRQEDYGAAIAAYRQVIVVKDLPLGMQQNVTKTLAQLSMVKGDYKAALQYLDKLIRISEEPRPDHFALKAQVLYQLEATMRP